MELCLRRARRGQGQTGDNPSVGCLIVSSGGSVCALAHTAPGGRPHAEISALGSAGDLAVGSQVYVTLEPCAHWGCSGPCVDALIKARVAKVVIGVKDTNPKVSGKGMSDLRAAGIEVTVVNDSKCRFYHAGFNRRMEGGFPKVIMKIATSADGSMTRRNAEKPLKITGLEVQRQVHILRARSDVIITGKGTWTIDQPQLNVRLPGYNGSMPNILVWRRHMDLAQIRANQILIEAGPTLASSLFGYVDELHWYRSPDIHGDQAVRPQFLTVNPLDFAPMWPRSRLLSTRRYGRDLREVWGMQEL